MRKVKNLLIIRYLNESILDSKDLDKLKEILEVDAIIYVVEQSPKEALHYPNFEVVEL